MTYKIAQDCQLANINQLYNMYFNDKLNGYFVEVGAFDGYHMSNTWGLAEAGWEGLYVEPNHFFVERCKEVHKRNLVAVAECAISDFDGETEFWLEPNSASCTIDRETMERSPWGFKYDPTQVTIVTARKLDTLLVVYKVPPKFDLLVIDVEGAELKVLAGFSWKLWQPKMIIIEDCYGNVDPGKTFHTDAITNWFLNTDYKHVQYDGVNSIYILEEKK